MVHDYVVMSLMQQCFVDAGFQMIQIAPGEKKIFMHSLDHKAVLDTINDVVSFFSQFFVKLFAWHLKVFNLERKVWLRMYGIPLHFWNMEFFNKILSNKRSIQMMDFCTSNRSCLDFARFYVQTSMMHS